MKRDSRGRFLARKRNPKAEKPKSKKEVKRIAKGYDQLTLTETGDPKKDYIKARLFNPRTKVESELLKRGIEIRPVSHGPPPFGQRTKTSYIILKNRFMVPVGKGNMTHAEALAEAVRRFG